MITNALNGVWLWCLRNLTPADHYPERIRKIDKLFGDELNFEDIEFLVKIKNIHKTEKKKNSIGISVFGYESQEKYLLYLLINTFKECVKLLLIE